MKMQIGPRPPTERAMSEPKLLPCPWCAAGKTDILDGPRVWSGMKYSDPSSVSVRHWCPPIEGQPSCMIERMGRDRESAIAAWNTRAKPEHGEG